MLQASISCCLLLVVAFFCPSTIASGLVIGVPQLAPYASQQGSVISGMYVDMLQTVFDDMGIDYRMRIMPPESTTLEFMNGALDVTISAYKTPALSKAMHFSHEPLSSELVALMGRVQNPSMTKNSEKLKKFSIGAIGAFSPELSVLPKCDVTLASSQDQLLQMLFADKVQYIVAEEAIMSSFAQQHGFPPLTRAIPLGNRPVFAVFSKLRLGDDTESLSIHFDAALRRLKERGDWVRILERYTKASQTIAPLVQ